MFQSRTGSAVASAKTLRAMAVCPAELATRNSSSSMASDALKLVEAVGEEGEQWSAGTWTSAAITRHLMGAIATAVQRGNAMAMLCGYTRAVRVAAAAVSGESGLGDEEDEDEGMEDGVECVEE